jgi:CpeT protein
MIDIFNEWFEGKWENKVQAFSYPSKFAMVQLVHKKIQGTESMYYGEQAYNYQLHAPYRQFIVEAIEDNGSLRIKNYDFDKNFHLGFKNLESRPEGLTHKQKCDTIMTYDPNKNQFNGSIDGCECWVPYKEDQMTYVRNEATLGVDFYNVVDRGFLVGTVNQVWGGRFGEFEFKRMPL